MALTLTASEAARILKISKYTLYELVKRGEIPAYHIGRQLRINPAVLDQYLQGTLATAADQPLPPEEEQESTSDTPKLRFI